jgi:preprotein translocase subunit SecE
MAKDPGIKAPTTRAKAGARAAGAAKPPSVAAKAPAAPKKPFNPVQFAKEVRSEARKITWTSWKETWINAVLVFILVAVTAVFFLLVDGSLSFLIQQLLRLASS